MKVAVTDYTFDDLDVERAILEPMGCQVVGPYPGEDKAGSDLYQRNGTVIAANRRDKSI